MSRKFFTLIRGDAVAIAPKVKVLPAKELSQLMQADDLLKAVDADAENYKLEVAETVEKLKVQAQQEGFEAGFSAWAEALAALESKILQVQSDMEKAIAPIALAAAKKIVGREIDTTDAIVDIVANSLKSVAQHQKVLIYVNKKEFEILESNRPRLRDIFENLEALSIRIGKDIAPGGCVIETESGIINAQLENQWRSLEKAFEGLLKKDNGGVH